MADAVRRVASHGFNQFFFVDNTFNVPEPYALELCRELSRLRPNVNWRCIIYPQRMSEELASAMAAAGCTEVSLGFESGCPRILRTMNKRFLPDDVRRTAQLLAANGVRLFGFLLFGMPGETPESVEESLRFAHALPLHGLRTTVGIRIYPGTALAATAVAEGVIASEEALLEPRFYLAPGLEPWIHARLQEEECVLGGGPGTR